MFLNVWGAAKVEIRGKALALRHRLEKKGLKPVILVSSSECHKKRKLNPNRTKEIKIKAEISK